MTLRDYQLKAIEALYAYLRDCRDNPVIVAPTGSGKSLIIAQVCKDVCGEGGRVIVLAHVRELLEQNADKIQKLCPDVYLGVYSAGLKARNTTAQVIVAGIQSVRERACELGAFDIIIIDESHRISPNEGTSYRKFISEARVVNPNLRVIGLTATPYRLDCGPLCAPENLFNSVCYDIAIQPLIDAGYLCPLSNKASRKEIDETGMTIRAGEFVTEEVDGVVATDAAVEETVTEILEKGHDRRTILIFANSVKHAEMVVASLEKKSEKVGLIVSDTKSLERASTLEAFADGSLRFLVNVGVLTTGYDNPTIDMIAIVRMTMSPSLMVQMIGRGLRPHHSKTNCLILDFGKNIKRHGTIDDIRPKKKTDVEGAAPAKECPECHEVCHAAVRLCPACGYEFPPPVKLQAPTASTAAVLKAQKEIKIIESEVLDTRYSEHRKKGSEDEAPRTLRVEYKVGKLGMWRSEWVCFEHDGFARRKAEQWWAMRCYDPCPRTISRVLEVIDTGGIAPTLAIRLREKEGEKFPEIVEYLIGEIPAAVPEDDYPTVLDLAERRRGQPLPEADDPFGSAGAELALMEKDIPW